MSNKKAFVYSIVHNGKDTTPSAADQAPNTSATDQKNPVKVGTHQSSPAWVLTFIRWNVRDTLRNSDTLRNPNTPSASTSTRDPLVVENDCISVETVMNKGNLTHHVSIDLKMTDINYETDVAPGDFVFVNMLNWPNDARDVANRARNLQPINKIKDGLKGFFKVQSVRRDLRVDPRSGVKTLVFKVEGFSFTEFNNTIYFNPFTLNTDFNSDIGDYARNFQNTFNSQVTRKGFVSVQDIIKLFITTFIGEGFTTYSEKLQTAGIPLTQNAVFEMPAQVGALLGIPCSTAKDVYFYLFGIQTYAVLPNSTTAVNLGSALNPSNINYDITQKNSNFIYTTTVCAGSTYLKPEYWNSVAAWDIISQYVNSPLNEIYTTFKVSPAGTVMPFVVLRQMPFTNDDFSIETPVTRFLNIPRWRIDPALIISQNIGRDEAARINFVQYFGKSGVDENGDAFSQESKTNFVRDVDDIRRNGLKPHISMTMFDPPGPDDPKTAFNSPTWAKIVADAIMGGHLKMNGNIVCAGIVDPIPVGDNLQLDGIVYHIEQVVHSCQIDQGGGSKQFRTTISLSHGISVDSSSVSTVYAYMEDPNAYKERIDDFANAQLLPGVSESQDTAYRSVSPDKDNNATAGNAHTTANAPYVQPNPLGNNSQFSGNKKGSS